MAMSMTFLLVDAATTYGPPATVGLHVTVRASGSAPGSARPLRAEAVSVFDRARADAAGERAAHRLGCAEPGCSRHVGRAEPGGLQQPAGDLDAHPLDVGRGCATDLVTEHPREVPRAHRDTCREPFDRVVGVGMVGDPGLE